MNEPIKCQAFGAGVTIIDGEPAAYVIMGEEPGEPTHLVAMDIQSFNHFINKCVGLAGEMSLIENELDGLEGLDREAQVQVIIDRYTAPVN